ncbi:MAG TPA: SPOR domain-containing protein [Sphingomicrobium sp.]|nr:SPOR domain-containing protein [Sphingomicrobium sp.]
MDSSRPYDDSELPWLAAVENEDGPRGVSARRMVAALLIVLLGAAIVAGTFFWLGRQEAVVAGAPQLIRAEPGPYKVRPADPGGLDVAGESETAFKTSAGEDSDAQLDLDAIPEAPVARPAKQEPRPVAAEPAKPAQAEAEPAAPAAGKGSVIQLGAFANRAQAERAWSALAARFPTVGAMTKLVIPFSGGIRLRAAAASPAAAREACQALKVAGENCFVAN